MALTALLYSVLGVYAEYEQCGYVPTPNETNLYPELAINRYCDAVK